MPVRFAQDYRPLYFLAALGAGGLAVSFFMYLMFLVPHPGTPVPTFEHLSAVFADGSAVSQVLVAVVLGAIAWFAVAHVRLLVANLVAFRQFTRTPAFTRLRRSNAEVSLMAVPLTLAMSVNVAFVLTALAVPGMWPRVEFLFPFSLLAFTAIGGYALALVGRYLVRILTRTGFDIEDTNHFSQVLPSFAFAMIAVGFAAPGAMSREPATSIVGILGAFTFAAAAAMWAAVTVAVSFGHMLRKGMAVEAGPTLWIGIPILTLLGITFLRVGAGISHNLLAVEFPAVLAFVVFGLLLAAQVVLGLFGWAVMHRQRYVHDYVLGDQRSVASYGLVCPGVALSVLAMFFIHWGLVRTGTLELFSASHIGLLGLVLAVQVLTIATLLRLNRKLLGSPERAVAEESGRVPVPA